MMFKNSLFNSKKNKITYLACEVAKRLLEI